MRLARSTILLALCVSVLLANSSHAQAPVPASNPEASISGTSAPATLLFDEEFDGTTLNLNTWYRCFVWANEDKGCGYGPPIDLEWYIAGHATVAGGFLRLTATKKSTTGLYPSGFLESGGIKCSPPACDPARTQPPGFQFHYGYMEMRSKFPSGKGMWPAFWLLSVDGTWPPEIDAMEWQGGTPTIDYATIHWKDSKGIHRSSGTAYDTGVDLSADFHTYGLDWQRGSVTWYFDGIAIKTFRQPSQIPHKPMYVILDLAVGGWISFPDKGTHFPATMLTDYVRVWDHKP